VTQKKISNFWKETKTQKTKKFTWKIILPKENHLAEFKALAQNWPLLQRSIPKISDEGIPEAFITVPKDNHEIREEVQNLIQKHSPTSKIEFTRTSATKFGLFIPRIPSKTTTVAEVLVKFKTSFPNIEVTKLFLTKTKTKKDANGKIIKKTPSALIYLSNANDQNTVLQKGWCRAILSFEKPDIKPKSPTETMDLTKNSFQALTNLNESEMPPPKPPKKRTPSVGHKRKAETPNESPRRKISQISQPKEASFPQSDFKFTTDPMTEDNSVEKENLITNSIKEKRQEISQTNHLISNSEVVDKLNYVTTESLLEQNIKPALPNKPNSSPKVQQTLHSFFTNSKESSENKQ
jgi:hypothetical protein